MSKTAGFKIKIATLLCLVLAMVIPQNVSATLTLGSLFQDHMVLQRDIPVPVWGITDPGAEVTVVFANQNKMTTAGMDGKWMLQLDPLTASFEPETMTVTSNSKGQIVEFSDVLVGEVWICSGQSNMQFQVAGVPDINALIQTAKNIRSFTVKNTVSFTEQAYCEGSWVESFPNSAVAFGFAYFLEEVADVPVGIILTSWGSSSIEAWMPRDMTETVPHFKVMMEDFDADTATQNRIEAILTGPQLWSNADDIFLRRQSNIVYNAMMKPLAPFACRGIVWYQGERNTQSMFGMSEDPWWSKNSGMLKYGEVEQKWMLRYRKEWNRDDFQFLIVMLPGYGGNMEEGPEYPDAPSWAWMRESQLKALELTYAAVTNTIDLGDLTNVHPKDKLPVAQRLALLAARNTLGQNIEAQGPIMSKVKVRGNKLTVYFEHAHSLKTIDGMAPTAFWLADDSRQWVRAEAEIKGQTVVLKSAELKKPLYVRYAFAGKPKVNLVNGAELPAYPFRTDRFAPPKDKEN